MLRRVLSPQNTFSCKWVDFLLVFFFFCLACYHFLTLWAVSIVSSSRLTHSLWLISLCLSWILLPAFEALQWADDCLGRDYYTNLSTLLCQTLSPGRLTVCVCVCVSVCVCVCVYVSRFHYTGESVCVPAPLSVCSCVPMSVWVCSICVFTVHACVGVPLQWSAPPRLFPVAVAVSGFLPTFITAAAQHTAKPRLCLHVRGCEFMCSCAC